MPDGPQQGKRRALAGERHESDRFVRNSGIGILTEFLFVVAPFIVLLIIYLGQGRGRAIWAAPDWSLASAVLYGQTMVKLMAGVTASRRARPEPAMLIAALILVFGLFPSLAILYWMVDSVQPALLWQIAQLIWFIGASGTFLVIGTVGQVLVARAAEANVEEP
jgi:Zn-dependent protease with chaperone function